MVKYISITSVKRFKAIIFYNIDRFIRIWWGSLLLAFVHVWTHFVLKLLSAGASKPHIHNDDIIL